MEEKPKYLSDEILKFQAVQKTDGTKLVTLKYYLSEKNIYGVEILIGSWKELKWAKARLLKDMAEYLERKVLDQIPLASYQKCGRLPLK